MTSHHPNPKLSGRTFLLWGDDFDEVAAIVFATELRKSGLRVEVVGVGGAQASGRHGFVLGSNMVLGNALALALFANCVIIPCNSAVMHQVDNDPRVGKLLEQACANQALFVVRDLQLAAQPPLRALSIPSANVAGYAGEPDLISFAQAIATKLTNRLTVS